MAEAKKLKIKTIIIIFVILLLLCAGAFYYARDAGFVGKFTEAAGFGSVEKNCYDLEDNDGDTLTDCADPDCNEKACDDTGGCLCQVRQAKEVRCWDSKDNDADGLIDSDDPNCVG
jgi:hypothetical protein|tara:strand:- start:11378 stop:11725 length:348 start_codon:yes stop_codon:yes gene_type:complete